MISFGDLTRYLGPAAAGLAALLAIVMLRPRSPRPALFIAIGAGIEAVHPIVHWVAGSAGVAIDWLRAPWLVAAVGLVFYGFIELLDERFPRKGITLPAEIQKYRRVDKMDFLGEAFLGLFAVGYLVLSLAGTYGMEALTLRVAAGSLAVLAALAGSVWFRSRHSALHWVLERVPDSVVWVYAHKTFIVNRGTTFWSACIALKSGVIFRQPTPSEADAQELLAAVLAVCPSALAGYDALRAAQFRQDPASLRAGK